MKTETKTQHTPGPWKYQCTNAGEIGSKDKVSVESETGHIATVKRIRSEERNSYGAVTYSHRNLLEVKANARLIAAAPELKRFAEAILESVDDVLRPGSPDTFMSLVNRMRDYRNWAKAAIAKAEGK